MTEDPANLVDKEKPDRPATEDSRDQLLRERELVCSEGTISKPVMATAFGLVFLVAGAVMAFQSQDWYQGLLICAIGCAGIAWAISRWLRLQVTRKSQMNENLHDDDVAKLFRDNDNLGAESNVLLRPMRQLLNEGKTLGPMTALFAPVPDKGSAPFGVLTWTGNQRIVFWPILPKSPSMVNVVDHITLEFPSERSHLTYYSEDGKAKHLSASDVNQPTAWRLVPFPNTDIALWFTMAVKTSMMLDQDLAVQRRVQMPSTDSQRRLDEYVRHVRQLNIVDVPLPPDQTVMPSYICFNIYLVADTNGNIEVTPDAFVQAWRTARIEDWAEDTPFTIQPFKLECGGHQFVIATACPPGRCLEKVSLGMPRPRRATSNEA